MFRVDFDFPWLNHDHMHPKPTLDGFLWQWKVDGGSYNKKENILEFENIWGEIVP